MYRLDKKAVKLHTNAEAEVSKRFAADVPLEERLRQAWYLTCMAHGIDPENPPRMIKEITAMRKHPK